MSVESGTSLEEPAGDYSRGHVQDIRFDPRVYRRPDSGELPRAVMQLISEATAAGGSRRGDEVLT
ncbi:MAG: hypothetical protein JWP48_227 [Actinoallomurus sp.]|jgi:hypothetical protein|nr:hypothetical protein [Actinoallomurus sp.]